MPADYDKWLDEPAPTRHDAHDLGCSMDDPCSVCLGEFECEACGQRHGWDDDCCTEDVLEE